jgi:hypothetical protein
LYKLILCVLILVAALTIACGGDDDEATPEATDEPTEGTGATTPASDEGAGETFSSSQLPISVTVTVPEGWEQPSDADSPDLFAVVEPGISYIDFLQPTQVYNRPTETDQEVADPPADYVGWLDNYPFLRTEPAGDVTVGGLQGTRFEVSNNVSDEVALFELSDGSNYGVGYRQRMYIHILNSGGTQIIVVCGNDRPDAFEESAATCEDVLSTVEFGT